MNALEIIGERLASIEAAVAAGAPLLMSRSAYGERVDYCPRYLDATLPEDCWAGRGRARRIIVARADAFLLSRTSEPNAEIDDGDEDDAVERSARRAARRSR